MDTIATADLDKQFGIVRLIYFAMLASVGLCLGIGTFLASVRGPAASLSPTVLRGFYAASAGLILVASLLRRRLVRSPSPGATPAAIQKWAKEFLAGQVISFALCEAIGILGLVAVFLSGSKRHLVSLVALSFTALLLFRPKRIH